MPQNESNCQNNEKFLHTAQIRYQNDYQLMQQIEQQQNEEQQLQLQQKEQQQRKRSQSQPQNRKLINNSEILLTNTTDTNFNYYEQNNLTNYQQKCNHFFLFFY